MMPDRSGGSPSYAYPAYKDRWPRFAEHVNGFTAWAYWLGWFPVAPLNMILASFYIVDRFEPQRDRGLHADPHVHRLVDARRSRSAGSCCCSSPPIRGLRFGTLFATALALLSMIPLTFLAISWIFNPVGRRTSASCTHFQPHRRHRLLRPSFGHGWLTIYIAFSFLLTWNVIAMEAAACYIGETRNPDRDAKIAMNLEGAYGVFIYTMIPVAFVIVIGTKALGNRRARRPEDDLRQLRLEGVRRRRGQRPAQLADRDHADPGADPLGAERDHRHRALAAPDVDRRPVPEVLPARQQPRRAGPLDVFNVVCSIIVVFFGGAVEIYTFSNVGYLASFIPVLIGYYLLRKHRPNVRRPFKLPEWMKYVALALAAFYAVIYFYGGPVYAVCACNAAGRKTLPYYFIGIARAARLPAAVLVAQARSRTSASRESAAATPAVPTAGGASP